MRNAFKILRLDILLRPIMLIRALYFRLSPWMITCREFDQSIYDYLEGDLSKPQLSAFNRHKRACPICRNFLKTYSATHKATEQITPYSDLIVDETAPQELVKAILDVKQQQ
ncbi:MAG: zf-HC2 domain-containing protein [Maricaulaceae bacterium]